MQKMEGAAVDQEGCTNYIISKNLRGLFPHRACTVITYCEVHKSVYHKYNSSQEITSSYKIPRKFSKSHFLRTVN